MLSSKGARKTVINAEEAEGKMLLCLPQLGVVPGENCVWTEILYKV